MTKLRKIILRGLVLIAIASCLPLPVKAESERINETTLRNLVHLRETNFFDFNQLKEQSEEEMSFKDPDERVTSSAEIRDIETTTTGNNTITITFRRRRQMLCRPSTKEASESVHIRIQDTLNSQYSETTLSRYLESQPEDSCRALYRYRLKVAETLGIEMPRVLINGL